MKRKLRLTESDLVNLVGKIIEEQSYEESAFDEHMGTIEHIANHFNNETTEDELDFMLTHQALCDEHQNQYQIPPQVLCGEIFY